MMKNRFRLLAIVVLTICVVNTIKAQQSLDSFIDHIDAFNNDYPQEKVYLHFDNTSYFIGEKIWFKAYVVTAAENIPTTLSRVLYVELLAPEGDILEIKKLKIENGQCHGDFDLDEKWFAGYYEVRAYTRYMLNFCNEEYLNYVGAEETKDMSKTEYGIYIQSVTGFKNYVRHYCTLETENSALFSRTVTVYDKPSKAGAYEEKQLRFRPRIQRRGDILTVEDKPLLSIMFYPEGGQMITGKESIVGFVVVDNEGEHIDLKGQLTSSMGEKIADVETMHQGMGSFVFTPDGDEYKIETAYLGQNYSFKLPQSQDSCFAMGIDNSDEDWLRIKVQCGKIKQPEQLGMSVMCRGVLYSFETFELDEDGVIELEADKNELPTGVNQITLFSGTGRVYAERLVFVNHKEHEELQLMVKHKEYAYESYEKVLLDFELEDKTGLGDYDMPFSISVRDAATEDVTYNTDNILTNLLLSSEIKGFIANPDYYFESDDEQHREALDLLLMVQGWRRYDWRQMAGCDTFKNKQPIETGILIDGFVGEKTKIDYDELEKYDAGLVEPIRDQKPIQDCSDIGKDRSGIPSSDKTLFEEEGDMLDNMSNNNIKEYNLSSVLGSGAVIGMEEYQDYKWSEWPVNTPVNMVYDIVANATVYFDASLNGNPLFSKSCITDENGNFSLLLGDVYGEGDLLITVDDKKDSVKNKFLERFKIEYDKTIALNGRFISPTPRDKFSFYEKHRPVLTAHSDVSNHLAEIDANEKDMTKKVHPINEVDVNAKKPKRVIIDYDKPNLAFIAQDLFDYEIDLYHDIYRQPLFTSLAHYAKVGDMPMRILVDLGDSDVEKKQEDYFWNIREMLMNSDTIKVYSDVISRERYRQDDYNRSEIPVVLMRICPNKADSLYTDFYNARLTKFQGYSYVDEFYNPDYRQKPLPEQKDYRRTLYWNPNVKLDEDGKAHVEFYNNSTCKHINISAEMLTSDGIPVVCEKQK